LSRQYELAEAVKALAPRLGAEQAGGAARGLLGGMMGPTSQPDVRRSLANAGATPAPQLHAQRARGTARLPPEGMTKLTKRGEMNSLPSLADAVATLTSRLGPEEAAERVREAARLLLDALRESSDAFDLGYLAAALVALAPQFDPQQARVAARLAL